MVHQIPRPIVEMMAARASRQHHYLWHEVRNMWLSYDGETRETLTELGWQPPRPARRAGQPGGAPGPVIVDNNSGEDFLFMHRQMIAAVNEELERIQDPEYPKIVGWEQVPRPADADYPVPPPWETGDPGFDGFLQDVKSDRTFNESFLQWEADFTDPANLRQLSLGQLGARLEFTVHNSMHMRWCSKLTEPRPDVDPTAPNTIDKRWDDPAYDWLGDTYSSHVNSVFWKLHGWVDNRINDWMRANAVAGDVPCETGTPWVGDMPHGREGQDPHLLMARGAGDPRGLSLEEHDDHGHKMDEALAAVIR